MSTVSTLQPVLFNPGPVNTTASVKAASVALDMCHRAGDFVELMRSTADRVSRLHPGTVDTVMLSGSATYALEAAVTAFTGPGTALVLGNGVYGDRLAAILDFHGIPFDTVEAPLGEGQDLAAIRAALDTGRYGSVLFVHHETSSGWLNDLDAVSRACEAAGATLLVDAVSSIGVEELTLHGDRWVTIGSANKCIEGLPGVSFVSAPTDAWTTLQPGRSFSLDLAKHHRAQRAGSLAFTPPVNAILGLHQALVELEAETVRGRRRRYLRALDHVTDGLARLGIERLVSGAAAASSLAAFALPDGVSFGTLEAHLWERGMVAYASQGSLQDTHFRIAVMGEKSLDDLDRLVAGVAELGRA